jgi:8-oxo-dGTP pyrophosphatase MutT (NUDIX family)
MRTPHEVLVVVRRDADYLVMHRAPEYEAYWHLVSGGVEPGESAREAALRELDEEVGLAAATLVDLEHRFAYPLADESEWVRSRYAPDVEEVVVDCFLADVGGAWEPVLNDEHDDYRWCAAPDAAALLFWPEPRELVLELSQ